MILNKTYKDPFTSQSIHTWVLEELGLRCEEYDLLRVRAESSDGRLTRQTQLPIDRTELRSKNKANIVLMVEMHVQHLGRRGCYTPGMAAQNPCIACVRTKLLKKLCNSTDGPITLRDIDTTSHTAPYVYSVDDSVQHSEYMDRTRFIELAGNRLRLVSRIRDDHSVDRIAAEAENLYREPHLDRLSLQCAVACLCTAAGVEHRTAFSEAETLLFSERLKLRGMQSAELAQQHHENIVDEFTTISLYLLSQQPAQDQALQEVVAQALSQWKETVLPSQVVRCG